MKVVLMKRQFPFLIALLALAAATSCTHKYPLQGEVVEKNVTTNEIVVNHGDIPGFMSAMAMPYRVKDPAVLREVEPGDRITATVAVGLDRSNYWLEDVRITDRSGRGQFHPPPGSKMLATGARVPEIALVNQDGRKIRLSDFSGKAVLVTFIYTRCPMPDFCPRLSGAFAQIHNQLKKNPKDYNNTHLVTISFDPKYDTPAVLRKYGLNYLEGDQSGFAHWDFASTNSADLHQLAEAFGLEYGGGDAGIITHSMIVVLIAPDGTVARYWSTNWTSNELMENLQQALHGGGPQVDIDSTVDAVPLPSV